MLPVEKGNLTSTQYQWWAAEHKFERPSWSDMKKWESTSKEWQTAMEEKFATKTNVVDYVGPFLDKEGAILIFKTKGCQRDRACAKTPRVREEAAAH